MAAGEGRQFLKKILKSYGRLEELRRRAAEPGKGEGSRRTRRRALKKKIAEIGREIGNEAARSPLIDLVRRYGLDEIQTTIILGLLKKRVTSDSPLLTGREILEIFSEEPSEILDGLSYIDDASVLVSAGIIVPGGDEPAAGDLLDVPFRLSERIYRLILDSYLERREFRRLPLKKSESPYRNNNSYLLDLRKLSLLYRKRATRIFDYDYWNAIGLGVSESAGAVERRMEALRENIAKKLEKTRKKDKLHAFRFAADYNLSEEELVILVTLLFQELVEGNAYVSAVDLLKLVARSEEDILRKRRFFSKRNPLVRHRLIVLEDAVNGKELTGEVFMPNWVVDLMTLGRAGGKEGIDTDARLDFHKYLEGLDSSEDFFDDLDI